MSDREPAPNDGIQIVNGQRFRAVRGELMMHGAKFEPHAVTEAAHQEAVKAAAGKGKGKGGAKAAGPAESTDATGPEATA